MSDEKISIEGKADELSKLFGGHLAAAPAISIADLDDFAIGEYVIIRTYSAGVWFGICDHFEMDA